MVFIPSLSGEFLNWDDTVGLVRNDAYRGLGWPQIRWDFTNTHVGHYMPLTWLSFGVSYVLMGMEPSGYHAVNLLLHGVNASLFLLIAVRLLGAAAGRRAAYDPPRGADRRPAPTVVAGAVLAALVFGVHPQRVEAVAWITGRSTVLSGFFYLLAVLTYLRATDGGRIRWRWAGAVSVGAFVAAVLAHPIAMTLPLSLLVLDAYPLLKTNILRAITAHMDDALTRLRELATLKVSQRLAHTLLRLTAPTKADDAGHLVVPHTLTRQELAELTGTTLFTVSRILTDWEAAGLVKSSRAHVEVLDTAGLRDAAEGGD